MGHKDQLYPIGIETFEYIREYGYLYVDKTRYVYDLTHLSKFVFLSRPRRFGKSLLLSTIKSYFEARRDLFDGLAIASLETEWRRHPVLKLNLAAYNPTDEGSLDSILDFQLLQWEKEYDIEDNSIRDFSSRFRQVITRAYEKTGERVVILIDEYDSPLVGHLDDSARLERYRDTLKSVYANLKICDEYIRFGMLTGVSRFSKMSVFSGLNNLEDISLRDRFGAICGITEDELREYFKGGIKHLSEDFDGDCSIALAELKSRYDGYHFSRRCPDVYNPFSVLNALASCDLLPYWYGTGTPTFLVKRIRDGGDFLPEMFTEKIDGSQLAMADLASTTPVAMLFQTGYLTIKGYDRRREQYILGLPNREVKLGLFRQLSQYYLDTPQRDTYNGILDIRFMLEDGNVEQAMERIKAYLAGIPYELSNGKPEIYFENNLYILFNLIGIDARAEWHTSRGRIDMLLKMPEVIYVMELKLDGTAREALEQIDSRDYALPFELDGRRVVKIGINFSKQTRNISDWIIG